MGPSGEILSISGKIFKKSVKKLNYMAVNKKNKTILDNSESETHILHVGYSLWLVLSFCQKRKKRNKAYIDDLQFCQ